MTLGQEIYNAIVKHCGNPDEIVLKGVTKQSLHNMRDGKGYPSLPMLKSILEVNGIPCDLNLKIKVEGKTVNTKLKLK